MTGSRLLGHIFLRGSIVAFSRFNNSFLVSLRCTGLTDTDKAGPLRNTKYCHVLAGMPVRQKDPLKR